MDRIYSMLSAHESGVDEKLRKKDEKIRELKAIIEKQGREIEYLKRQAKLNYCCRCVRHND